MLVGDRHRGVASERRPAGEQFVHEAAGRVQVGPRVDPFAACLLRRQVLCGTDDLRGLGHRGLGVAHRARDAEVHHLDVTIAGHHDVAGLDVPVHDAGLVAVLKGAQHAGDDLKRPLWQQPVALDQQVPHRSAVHELHHDERNGHAGGHVLAGVVDGDNRGVVQRRRGLCLAAEPRLEGLVACEISAEGLDRDRPVQAEVTGTVNLGHAATPNNTI